MLNYIGLNPSLVAMLGVLAATLGTWIATLKLMNLLPRDQGRAFAQDGMLSAGKPRGAGIIFVFAFAISSLLFAEINLEIAIYLALTIAEMLTGYFDDAAEHPWGGLVKGLLDAAIAAAAAIVFVIYNGSEFSLVLFGINLSIPSVVFVILAIALIWGSINVTNCADGVDGLSACLTMVTLGTFVVLDKYTGMGDGFNYVIILFIGCLLGYLWFNATPSILLMGDAGSRAMGFVIAIAALKSGAPVFFAVAAFVIAVDGGLGLLKVSLIKAAKIYILKNTTTPLHDHVRKRIGWSNAQVVFRFVIIQMVISAAAIYIVMMH